MSAHQLDQAIQRFLSSPTQACLLLVNVEIAAFREQAQSLQARYDWSQLQIGPELSAELLNVAPKHRPQQARRRLQEWVSKHAPGPVLCTHIDLLFAPALKLDPLMLFRYLGKTAPLIVCWPGEYHDDALSYAVPEHAHYRTWRHPDALIVTLD